MDCNSSVVTVDQQKKEQQEAPNIPPLVYYVFYLLGMATLLPWNFFITIDNYWSYKFRNITSEDPSKRSRMVDDFYANMTAVSMWINMTFLIINAMFGHHFDQHRRMVVSMTVLIGLFVTTTVLVEVDSDSWQQRFMTTTLIKVGAISATCAIFQGTLFGLAAQIPGPYVSAVMSGQGMGAVFSNICCIISLSFVGGQNFQRQALTPALIFFIIAVATIVLSLAAYLWTTRLPYFQKTLLSTSALQTNDQQNSKKVDLKSFFNLLGEIKWFAAAVMLVFIVTISLFPAVTVTVVPIWKPESRWAKVYFKQVTCFLLFNVTDYLGRALGGRQLWPKAKQDLLLLLLTALRFVFIPLFMFCNLKHQHLSTVFASDLFYVLFMALFGLSNGYLATLCMIYGPKAVSEEKQNLISSSMAAFLGIGLSLGSTLSKVFQQLL